MPRARSPIGDRGSHAQVLQHIPLVLQEGPERANFGVTSQVSMVESGPGIARPSEILDLTCKVTGASLTDSTNMHCVYWIRQPEGKGLEWLGHICYENIANIMPSLSRHV
ncbi:unnamed protein product [Ranitomeya imitator]|uniref:Ig-like domain-containing protein n=1 Tax=Ranitomeya imitator TaxID=111125 RepID=A0ABN9MBL8_9NEOB|nr:unnamed protein product [Ranitomeya imitator]